MATNRIVPAEPIAIQLPTVGELLESPSVSNWLKDSLRSLVARDPVDAANDAELLSAVMVARCKVILRGATKRHN